MKNNAKKHDLIKVSGIMVLITALMTWIIPQSMFQNGEMVAGEITRIGLFDFFTYGFLGMYYFTVLVTFLFVLGGFYQVLSKTTAYHKLTDKLAKIFKRKEILFVLIVSFLIAAITAVVNEYFIILSIIPFIITILRKMNLDKITAFTTTFGSLLVGVLGSVYSTKIVGMNVNYLTIEYGTLLWVKLLLFGLTFLIFNTFNIIHIVKTLKSNKKDEQIEDLFETNDSTKKTRVWPLVVVLSLFFIILILAYLPWESVFKITWFADALNAITTFKVLDEPIFSYILGRVTAFGSWDLFAIQVLMVVVSIIIKLIYKIKLNDFFTAYGEGFKKFSKLVVILLITYLILEFAVMFPVLPTIVSWFVTLTDKFNVFLTTVAGLFTSLFTVEYQYTLNLIGQYLTITFDAYKEPLAIMLQSTFGLASMFAPSSAILLIGLSYLNISYKEWMKYIWKFLLAMFAVIIVLMLIIC